MRRGPGVEGGDEEMKYMDTISIGILAIALIIAASAQSNNTQRILSLESRVSALEVGR